MLTMLAALLSSISAPSEHVLGPKRVLRCASTAVDVKSAFCERVCDSARLVACPEACLCVTTPGESTRYERMSLVILRRLAARLHATPAAQKSEQMKVARMAAARAVTALSSRRAPAKDLPSCTSLVPGVTDESCATLCAVRTSCPEVCFCEEDAADKAATKKPAKKRDLGKPSTWIEGYYSWSWSGKSASNGTKTCSLSNPWALLVALTLTLNPKLNGLGRSVVTGVWCSQCVVWVAGGPLEPWRGASVPMALRGRF